MRNGKMESKGQSTILVAGIAVGFLLVFAVAAIDFSRMYYVRGELQNAADSAALAGAGLLDGTNSTIQTAARGKAVTFAGNNKAAGASVVLASNGTNTLTVSNDITVGNFDLSQTPKYLAGRTPINAVQVTARRTTGSPGGPVALIFGNLIQGLKDMGVKREAIATGFQMLQTLPLALCIKSCSMTGLPKLLDIQSNLPCSSDFGVAWTIFDSASSVPDNKISDLIDGTRKLTPQDITDLCGQCITTNNGATQSLNYLGDKFRDPTWDALNKDIVGGIVKAWRVGVVIENYQCNVGSSDPCTGCPPSKQGKNEPYHIQQWAKLTITQVCDNSDSTGLCSGKKGIVISSLTCVDCADNPLSILESSKPRLVR